MAHGNLILAVEGLAIEDEEGDDVIGTPLFQVVTNIGLESCECPQGRQQGFVRGRRIEKELEIVRCIYSDGAMLEFRYIEEPELDESQPTEISRCKGPSRPSAGLDSRSLAVDPSILDKS